MANTLKFGNGNWATQEGLTLAYNDENDNYKPLPFDFTRASNATVVNKEGLIETVGNGIPRIDFADSEDGALLLEPQSTNLITYSEDFSDSSWFKGNTTVIANQEISPSGIQDADKVTFLAVPNANIQLTSAIATTIGEDYTYSIWAKADANVNNVKFGGGIGGDVDLSITDEWQRFSVTFTAASASTITTLVTRNSVLANIYLWGAQIEEQSYPTSYIPTQGSTVTRLADSCSNGGNEQVINSTEGVLYAEISALESTSSVSTFISISDGTYNNRASILFSNGATNKIRTFLWVGGASQTDETGSVVDVTSFNKVAFKYKENDFALWINGVEVATDTSGSVWSADTITKLSFSEINTNAGAFNGKTKALAVYNTALSDSELEALTQV